MNFKENIQMKAATAVFIGIVGTERAVNKAVSAVSYKIDSIQCELKNRRNFDKKHNYDRKTGQFRK